MLRTDQLELGTLFPSFTVCISHDVYVFVTWQPKKKGDWVWDGTSLQALVFIIFSKAFDGPDLFLKTSQALQWGCEWVFEVGTTASHMLWLGKGPL